MALFSTEVYAKSNLNPSLANASPAATKANIKITANNRNYLSVYLLLYGLCLIEGSHTNLISKINKMYILRTATNTCEFIFLIPSRFTMSHQDKGVLLP